MIAQSPATTNVCLSSERREGLPRRSRLISLHPARENSIRIRWTDPLPPRNMILRQFPSICLPTGPPISLPSPAYPEHPSAYPLPTDHLCALRREPFEWQHERDACALDGPASPPSRRQPRRYSMSANSACPFGYRVTDVWPLPNCAPPSGQPSSEAHPPERFLSEPDNRGKCDHSYKRGKILLPQSQ